MEQTETHGSGDVDVLELPKPTKDKGDGDRFAHYVRKDRLSRAAGKGQAVVALCGKVWVPTRNAKNYPLCPKCKAIRDSMGPTGGNWPFSGD